jgi:hypothetical protein
MVPSFCEDIERELAYAASVHRHRHYYDELASVVSANPPTTSVSSRSRWRVDKKQIFCTLPTLFFGRVFLCFRKNK